MRTTALALLVLFPYSAAADDLRADIIKREKVLEFRAGAGPGVETELVAEYHFAGTVRAEKGDGTRPLAKPFFWPVNAPGGVPVTRGWPVQPHGRGPGGVETAGPGESTDHVHQKSAWFCHGDVIPEGVEFAVKSANKEVKGVDFWAEGAGHGRIVCVEVGEPKRVSAAHALIPTRNEWRTADGVKILDESRTLHLIALPTGRLIVLDIELRASVYPVTFGDTKEGSMGIRVHDAIRTEVKGGGSLTNSAGKSGEKDLWGYPADWCDDSGTVDGKAVGVAVFDDPANAYRAAWHARGYGLVAANPFGRQHSGFPSQKGKTELVKLTKGGTLKLRYGVYAHAGDAAAGQVAEAFETFAKMR